MPHRAIQSSRLAALTAILALAGIVGFTISSAAEVFHSKESALELAFGKTCTIESRELFLDQEEKLQASKIAGSEIRSRLVKVYEGRRDEELLGYVYFETHRVRTLPETLMVVVRADGSIQGVHLLAFHEPRTYLPHPRFLAQFDGELLDSELSLRTGLQGMAGSTFTARAVTAAVRRVMAVHQIVVNPQLVRATTTSPTDRVD